MSIYLAWSLYKLAGVVIVWAILFGVLLWTATKPGSLITKKGVAWMAGIWMVFVLLAAFNVGDRQQHLNRSSFNATFPVESPAYVPPPPDTVKAAREALDKNILELNNSIKERKQ